MVTVQERIQGYDVLTSGIIFTHDNKDVILHINEYGSDIVIKFNKTKNKERGEYILEPSGSTLIIQLYVLENNLSTFNIYKPLLLVKPEDEIQLALSCYGNVLNIENGELMFIYTLWIKTD